MMPKARKQGFTLIEIMIVVLIIGILMAIAVPNFIRARTNSRLSAVVQNLKRIEQAKDHYTMERGKLVGDAVASADLAPAYMKSFPADNTPIAGAYLPNAIGTAPTFGGKDATAWQTACASGGTGCTL